MLDLFAGKRLFFVVVQPPVPHECSEKLEPKRRFSRLNDKNINYTTYKTTTKSNNGKNKAQLPQYFYKHEHEILKDPGSLITDTSHFKTENTLTCIQTER